LAGFEDFEFHAVDGDQGGLGEVDQFGHCVPLFLFGLLVEINVETIADRIGPR
jgi:hypothetical protein